MRSISGLALGHQAGDHQARRGAQVGRHHRARPAAARTPLHHRGVALDLDVGAQALQLLHVHEAVLEDGLGDHARCRSATRVERHELRLHVGGEARIRRGAHAHRAAAAPCISISMSDVAACVIVAPASRSLSQRRVERVRRGAA